METTRLEQFASLYPKAPSYRKDQLMEAFFSPTISKWEDVTVLSKKMTAELQERIPWMSVKEKEVSESSSGDVYKAALQLEDEFVIESVLMRNGRDQWTVCVSAQVGCAMNCAFCATGKMGLMRQLTEDEIVDQYRYWASYLLNHDVEGRISNIVFMGMGEPLMNYDTVKSAINLILKMTDIGPTKITVSTVGILPRLEQLLIDPDWPPVRVAISLHSADAKKRKQLIPSSTPDFLVALKDWAKRYQETFGNRTHHLTFEYIMLDGVNDQHDDARQLANYANRIGNVKINLIPYNQTASTLQPSQDKQMQQFKSILESAGITVMVRKSLGQEIEAACGQLAK